MNAGPGRQTAGRTASRWSIAAALLLGCLGEPIGVAGADEPATRHPPIRETGTAAMKIRLTIDGKVAIAELDASRAAQDFAAMMPLTVTLTDYAATEKIGDLPRRLSHEGSPPGYAPAAGDIAYYAPWGNLAIFYRDFDYSPGLVRLGTIVSGIEALKQSGTLATVIETIP